MNAYIKFVCLSVVVLLATHTARSQQSNSLKIYFAENGVEHKLNNDFDLYIVLGDETGGTKGIYKAAVFDGNNIRLPEHDGVNYDFSEKCHIVLKYKGKCYYCFSLDRMMDLYLLQDRIENFIYRDTLSNIVIFGIRMEHSGVPILLMTTISLPIKRGKCRQCICSLELRIPMLPIPRLWISKNISRKGKSY